MAGKIDKSQTDKIFIEKYDAKVTHEHFAPQSPLSPLCLLPLSPLSALSIFLFVVSPLSTSPVSTTDLH
jgi:hypothetical protein